MAILWRTSALAQRHAEIGGELEDWNGMGTAWFYDHTPERAKADYEAIRTKAGLMDVSGLKKVHVVGEHAAYVIDRVTTRNVEKIAPGRSVYACILDERGLFVDDCVIYHIAVNSWLVVHGTGTGMEHLTKVAAGKNCSVIFDDDLHDMSLQGPKAVDILAQDVPGIRDLAYFGLMQTRLYGCDVMISRTGYTGERGYEIFCRRKDAVHLWDTILEKGGKDAGLLAKAHIIYIPKGTGDTYSAQLQALSPAQYYEGPTYAASVSRLRHVLANAHQGLQVYLTGTEGLMGQAQNEAMQAGIPHTAIQTEHRGSVARRMQCVHCKGITEDVMHDPFQCAHCGLYLFVRDHYSRRLAAYQGVCIDAEDPGNVPEPVELYS